MPALADRSLAAVSAPRRADRNTGLVELFAIIAIRMLFTSPPDPAPALPAAALSAPGAGAEGADFLQPAAAIDATSPMPASAAMYPNLRLIAISMFSPGGEPSCREASARLIEHHRDDDGRTDDDPLVVLIEVQ